MISRILRNLTLGASIYSLTALGAVAMPYVNDRVMDSGLTILDSEADRIDICTQEPTTYTEATSTYSKGSKDHGAAGTAFGTVGDRTPTGRKVSSTAVTDGTISGAGTVTHWAVTDVTNSRLLAAGALSASKVVASGDTWSLASFDIGIADAS